VNGLPGALVVAVGGRAQALGSWVAALRLGIVLVVAVAVVVPLVGRLAHSSEVAELNDLEDLYLLEAHRFGDNEKGDR
jgi:hypothetical protein